MGLTLRFWHCVRPLFLRSVKTYHYVSWLVKRNSCLWTRVETSLAPAPKIVHPVSDLRTWKPYPIQWHISVKDLIREYPPGKGHLYKINKSVKQTLKSWSLPSFTPFIWLSVRWTSPNLRKTVSTGPKGVRLKESWLCINGVLLIGLLYKHKIGPESLKLPIHPQ